MDGKNRESFSRCRIRIKKLLIRKFMMGRDRYNFDKLGFLVGGFEEFEGSGSD